LTLKNGEKVINKTRRFRGPEKKVIGPEPTAKIVLREDDQKRDKSQKPPCKKRNPRRIPAFGY